MLTTVYHILWQNELQAVFVMFSTVFTVLKQENIVCTEVGKNINTGVFILRTVDLTV